MSEYRISIEADSMAALDWAAERDAAVQFLQGMGAFISQVAPMAQQNPGAAPVLMKLLQWGVAKFRVSSEIESVLDQAIAAMQQQIMQPPAPPQPTIDQQIEIQKIEANKQIAMLESQTDKEVAALKATLELQKVELKAQMDQMQQHFENIREMLQLNPDAGRKLGDMLDNIHQMTDSAVSTQVQTQQQLAALMDAVSRKKRKVPIRNAAGDIIEVREVDEQPDMLPGTEAALTGGAPLPPAVQPQAELPPQISM